MQTNSTNPLTVHPFKLHTGLKKTRAIGYARGIGWANAAGEIRGEFDLRANRAHFIVDHANSLSLGEWLLGSSPVPSNIAQAFKKTSAIEYARGIGWANAAGEIRGEFDLRANHAHFYVAHKLILICECAAWTLPTFQAASS